MHARELVSEFYIINPYTFSELRCTRDRNVDYHEKYLNGGDTGIFKKNSVCSSTHPHENSGTTSVYIEKDNISDELCEWRTGSAGVYGW